jgi:hypothetical protein
MPRTQVQYPRAWCSLKTTVRNAAAEVQTSIVPHHASVSRRSHLQANSAELEIHGSALPFNPVLIEGVFVEVYLAAVARVDDLVQDTPGSKRFCGFVDAIHETRDDNGPRLKLEARDLSAIFRGFKPLPNDAVPLYRDTLTTAIQRILDATPGAYNPDGSPRVTLRAVPNDGTLTGAVHARAQGAAVQLPPDATAWGVIEHLCGLRSQLVRVELDEIVVYDPAQSYTGSSPSVAHFVFGSETANLMRLERERKFARNTKGVLVTSYDPISRRVLEAKFPADGDVLPDKRPRASVGGTVLHSVGRRRAAPLPPDRELFAAPNGIATQAELDRYAKQLYVQRSLHELEGKLTCPDWATGGENHNDVLAIQNGDRVDVQVTPDLAAELAHTDSEAVAVDLLRRRLLVNEEAARALVAASRQHTPTQYYVRTNTIEYDAQGVSSVQLEFCNLVTVS